MRSQLHLQPQGAKKETLLRNNYAYIFFSMLNDVPPVGLYKRKHLNVLCQDKNIKTHSRLRVRTTANSIGFVITE